MLWQRSLKWEAARQCYTRCQKSDSPKTCGNGGRNWGCCSPPSRAELNSALLEPANLERGILAPEIWLGFSSHCDVQTEEFKQRPNWLEINHRQLKTLISSPDVLIIQKYDRSEWDIQPHQARWTTSLLACLTLMRRAEEIGEESAASQSRGNYRHSTICWCCLVCTDLYHKIVQPTRWGTHRLHPGRIHHWGRSKEVPQVL